MVKPLDCEINSRPVQLAHKTEVRGSEKVTYNEKLRHFPFKKPSRTALKDHSTGDRDVVGSFPVRNWRSRPQPSFQTKQFPLFQGSCHSCSVCASSSNIMKQKFLFCASNSEDIVGSYRICNKDDVTFDIILVSTLVAPPPRSRKR